MEARLHLLGAPRLASCDGAQVFHELALLIGAFQQGVQILSEERSSVSA